MKAPKNDAALTNVYAKPDAVALNRGGATIETMVMPLEASQ